MLPEYKKDAALRLKVAAGHLEGVRRMVVAGGESSGAVVQALDVKALRIGPQIDPGVPSTVTVGERPLALALKSGNFGGEDFFTKALEVREKYSKIVALFATEAPQVNEVCHIWAYPDLNTRAEVRAASSRDPGWQEFLKAGAGLLEEMYSTVMLPAPHSPLK